MIEGIAATLDRKRESDADAIARLDLLVDTLILRGHLTPGHRRLLNRIRPDRSTVFLSMYRDKRSIESSDIDCAQYLDKCKARCCTFSVALSPEDIAEGKLGWEIYEP